MRVYRETYALIDGHTIKMESNSQAGKYAGMTPRQFSNLKSQAIHLSRDSFTAGGVRFLFDIPRIKPAPAIKELSRALLPNVFTNLR
jgi:hypothetical protein